MSPLISFIIPAYNCEATIERALSSICALHLPSYEILVIDDGSTDGTLAVLHRMVHRVDGALRIYPTDNRGVSHARNVGIDHASGDWITFVDADDIVEPEFAGSLSSLGNYHDTEIIRYSFARDNACRVAYCRFVNEAKTFGRQEIAGIIEAMSGLRVVKESILHPASFGCVCGVVYSRQLIESHNLRFNESLVMMEDSIFLIEALSYCRMLHVSPLLSYRYYDFGDSASRSWSKGYERALGELPDAIARALNRYELDRDAAFSSFCLTVASTLVHNRIRFSRPSGTNGWRDLRASCVLEHLVALVERGYSACSKRLSMRKRVQFFLIKNRLFGILELYYHAVNESGKWFRRK